MVLAVAPDAVTRLTEALAGERVFRIGRIIAGDGIAYKGALG